MMPVLFSGLMMVCAFSASSFAENGNPMNAFRKAQTQSQEINKESLLEVKNKKIADFTLSQAVMFGLEADLDVSRVVVETDSVGESKDGRSHVESFSGYFWASWKEDGAHKRGSCRLQASFTVPVDQSLIDRFVESGNKARLRVLLNGMDAEMTFRNPRENPVCFEAVE